MRTQHLLRLETRLMDRLKHHSIVRLFQVMETIQHVYLVMEYAPAGTLADLVRLRGQASDP